MFCSQQVERKQAWIQSSGGEAFASQRAGRRKRTHSTPGLGTQAPLRLLLRSQLLSQLALQPRNSILSCHKIEEHLKVRGRVIDLQQIEPGCIWREFPRLLRRYKLIISAELKEERLIQALCNEAKRVEGSRGFDIPFKSL